MAFKKKDKKAEEIHISPHAGDLAKLRDELNVQFGAVIASEVIDKPVTILPTGILSMDLAVGNGGMLGGRVADIWGWEGTGKTLMTMTIAGNVQRTPRPDGKPRRVAFLDAEGTFAPAFARSVGVDTDNLFLVRSTMDKILSGEDYFSAIMKLIANGFDYVIVDSCPALTPRAMIINEFGFAQKAPLGQLMAAGLNMITPLLNGSGNTVVHFINQVRGRPMATQWEPKYAPTGGEALKFFSTYRYEVVYSEDIVKEILLADGSYQSRKVGVTVGVKIHKNKTAPEPSTVPGKSYHFEFDIYFIEFQEKGGLAYFRGVDVVKDYIETGVRLGVIKQSSSWFNFRDVKANGKIDLTNKIREKPEIMSQIREEVFGAMSTGTKSAQAVAPQLN